MIKKSSRRKTINLGFLVDHWWSFALPPERSSQETSEAGGFCIFTTGSWFYTMLILNKIPFREGRNKLFSLL
jgi:hypothetical protein